MDNRIGRLQQLERPLVMGILNITPDSFSDGGQFFSATAAYDQAARMIDAGADILDIGGESTRPNATPVATDVELGRVVPVVEKLRKQFDVAISVDTSKPDVMRAAIRAGVDIVNDVLALGQPQAMDVVAASDVTVCLMHMRGEPRTMQSNPTYDDVVNDVKSFLLERANACQQAGIDKNRIWLDPGFGFGKTLAQNWRLFAHLPHFVATGYPVLVGISRKSMIGQLLDVDVNCRLAGSVTAAVLAAQKGANILRVHDVNETVQALKILKATIDAE